MANQLWCSDVSQSALPPWAGKDTVRFWLRGPAREVPRMIAPRAFHANWTGPHV
jgi:hypothetical protein